MSGQKLALFDFDGTITSKDSLGEFVIFSKGRWQYYMGLLMLTPVLVRYKLGLLPNWKAKEKLLSYFFRDINLNKFQQMCDDFVKNRIPEILRKAAVHQIRKHLEEGYRVVVVSASPENWVQVWAKSQGLECIATKLELEEGKLTGRISGKNCHGPEKVDRIAKQLDISRFSDICTYGDSRGDLEMLELGTQKYYKPFR